MSLRGTKQSRHPDRPISSHALNEGRNLPNYFPVLTGVRALAAYLVFISHYEYAFDGSLPQGVKRYLQEFHFGVTIFFVLSGFLIAYRYYNNFEHSWHWLGKYIRNRVARIYPMYFLLTIGTFIYYYYSGDKTIVGDFSNPLGLLALNLTFLRGFFNDLKFTGIAQGWSLTVEECFYISAPFIFYLAKRYKLFWVQVLLLTGLGFLLVLMFGHTGWYGFFGNDTFMMVYTFLGRCFEFFVGVKLATIFLKKRITSSETPKFTYSGLLLVFTAPLIMSLLTIPRGWTAGLHNPRGIITNNYFLAIAIALFFYGLLTENTWLKRLLANRFVELLGKSSYIFYLIHLGVVARFLQWGTDKLNDQVFQLYDKLNLDWHSPFENDTLNVLWLFIALNGISTLLFKLAEEPLNHLIRQTPPQPLPKGDGLST
ncbi:acyltransferase family protein [Mucilaginibacter ginkgonis]|uniref:Acyltransferase n=1 Tax=Mucilaginibacter ginkgonis TaxID=2682091 RepID=A0A6I4IP52_9SPHI|nr:acyltransferase [Mucilaginibacter ginkgonis]QQL48555.1 acyltransferase [Mucilaginibacter ginkgonis]